MVVQMISNVLPWLTKKGAILHSDKGVMCRTPGYRK